MLLVFNPVLKLECLKVAWDEKYLAAGEESFKAQVSYSLFVFSSTNKFIYNYYFFAFSSTSIRKGRKHLKKGQPLLHISKHPCIYGRLESVSNTSVFAGFDELLRGVIHYQDRFYAWVCSLCNLRFFP